MRLPRILTAVLLATTALCVAPALAAAPRVGKLYVCTTKIGGKRTLGQTVKIGKHHVYYTGYTHKGSALTGKTVKGRYSTKGKKISFPSGGFKGYSAVYHAAKGTHHDYFALKDITGFPIGESCRRI